MTETGIVTDKCYPYTAGSGVSGHCKKKCKKSKDTFTKYKSNTAKAFDTPAAIQAEILLNGPIETGFDVYEDFMNYTGGIYEHKTGSLLGGHAVKIIGWGNKGGVNYWIVANSWGTSWGLDGFFNIKFGECEFDTQGIAGTADVSSL